MLHYKPAFGEPPESKCNDTNQDLSSGKVCARVFVCVWIYLCVLRVCAFVCVCLCVCVCVLSICIYTQVVCYECGKGYVRNATTYQVLGKSYVKLHPHIHTHYSLFLFLFLSLSLSLPLSLPPLSLSLPLSASLSLSLPLSASLSLSLLGEDAGHVYGFSSTNYY